MYQFLYNAASPRHMVIARGLMGLKEIPGGKSNPFILEWAKELKLDRIYKDDDTSWCALFAAICMHRAGRTIDLKTKDLFDYLRALKYSDVFDAVANDDAAFGDILIFRRPSGGHIGFYVAEDATTYHVLGGNQSNMVNVIRIEKKRCVAIRRPSYQTFVPEKFIVDAKGTISSNEA